MTLELTSVEKAVLEAVFEQRKARELSSIQEIEMFSNPDVFVYDVKRGQFFIDRLKRFQEYEISYAEQLDALRSLTGRGIIQADWVVNNGAPDDPQCTLANGFDWAQNKFSEYEMLSDYYKADLNNIYFVNLSINNIKIIFDKYLREHQAQLSKDYVCLVVTCDNEEYRFPCLHDEKRPYEVISYAMEHFGEKITKEELNEVLKTKGHDPIGDIPFGKVFERNHTIREVLSPFIELKPKYMRVVENVKLTSRQLTLIKEECKSSSKI
ncbi:hypothetical protein IJI72_02325 [Candidatus Saccharibacteria bacterium]|nr:hypothetical protein [Candidatus Saccharibacteria bacterium]